MIGILRLLFVLLLAPVLVPAAEAGPIVYFDSYRSLNVDGTLFESTTIGFWSASGGPGLARTHRSTIGESLTDSAGHAFERIGGSGNLAAFSSVGPADLSTGLFTSFILDVPYSAHLDAFVRADQYGAGEAFLFNETTQTMLAQIIVDEGFQRVRFDGILEPGTYSYFLSADLKTGPGFHQSRAQFGGDLDLRQFTPVPEPATLSLFGFGLAAAAWRRRKVGSN